MIKEALQYFLNLNTTPDERLVDTVDQDGFTRILVINAEGNATEIQPRDNRAKEAIELNTLTGLVDYIKSNLDRKDAPFFLHVMDEETVVLKSTLLSNGKREELAMAKAIVPQFAYGIFHNTEKLIIAFQSIFTKTEDRDLLQKVVGSVKEENVRETGDDGISQAVTIKTGIASSNDVLVPNPVSLAPYRTFLEVEQPASDFIFRMKDGPTGAIFEADGGAWRNQAIINVRDYLLEQLSSEIESGRITIIA